MTILKTTINGEDWRITVDDGLTVELTDGHLTVLRCDQAKVGRVSRPFHFNLVQDESTGILNLVQKENTGIHLVPTGQSGRS
jgi:hypothetical protein